jgi:hypothetical protein
LASDFTNSREIRLAGFAIGFAAGFTTGVGTDFATGVANGVATGVAATTGFVASTALGLLLTALVFCPFDFMFFVVFIINSIH